ncbi:MAG: hypothetical protein PHO96_04150 [Candidatus Izemoplasmatales bacterium]|nr:hypothetical protein [Candidatus Izemoplasmatales bacterium]
MKKVLGFALLIMGLFVFAACDGATTLAPTTAAPTTAAPVTEAPLDEVTLNVAINYTSGGKWMGISYNLDAPYTNFLGHEYNEGDLAPAWEAIAEKLNINFVDMMSTQDSNTNAQWTRLKTNNFAGVDLVNGTGANIGPEGVNGNFVNIGNYLNQMPNLKAFLDANPDVRVSMTAADGGIYFTPYFDGFGEPEQMFLVRIDWIEDILDVVSPTFDTDTTQVVGTGENQVTYPVIGPTAYTRRDLPNGINADILVANADGTTRTVHKEYDDNILDVLAAIENPTGQKLAEAFRNHIFTTYEGQGYEKYSHVFAGTDAAYDVDELIALMYVIKANPKYLTRQHTTGVKTSVEVYFPREAAGNRIRNLFRGMEMWGLRGVFSRHEWMYFDEDGLVQDARHEERVVDAIGDLQTLYTDRLIVQDPETGGNWRTLLLNTATGFMTYDYNASSTTMSTGSGDLINTGRVVDPDLKFQAILPPVVDWLGDGNYFQFTEAVRSVKNEAWGIPKHVESNQAKLNRALMLVDQLYDYSSADSVGTIHLYGPVGYTDGTLSYGTDVVYKMSDEALAEMNSLAGGNMINYLRQYVGATMPIGHIRSLGLEFQTLSEEGIAGIERINTAVVAGTFKLAGQVDSENPWYNLSPTFFPLTQTDSQMIAASATFKELYTDANLAKLLKFGFTGQGGSKTVEEYWEMFEMGAYDVYDILYIRAYRDAYARIQSGN